MHRNWTKPELDPSLESGHGRHLQSYHGRDLFADGPIFDSCFLLLLCVTLAQTDTYSQPHVYVDDRRRR